MSSEARVQCSTEPMLINEYHSENHKIISTTVDFITKLLFLLLGECSEPITYNLSHWVLRDMQARFWFWNMHALTSITIEDGKKHFKIFPIKFSTYV